MTPLPGMALDSHGSMPGRSLQMTRRPQAMASMSTRGSPSKKDGRMKIWLAFSS